MKNHEQAMCHALLNGAASAATELLRFHYPQVELEAKLNELFEITDELYTGLYNKQPQNSRADLVKVILHEETPPPAALAVASSSILIRTIGNLVAVAHRISGDDDEAFKRRTRKIVAFLQYDFGIMIGGRVPLALEQQVELLAQARHSLGDIQRKATNAKWN